MVAATRETLLPLLEQNVSNDAMVVTDGLVAYSSLNKHYKLHVVVNHVNDE